MRNLLFLATVFLIFSCNQQPTNNTSAKPMSFGATTNTVDSVALKNIDLSVGIDPAIWGAKPDGITDCTWALNECAKWATKQPVAKIILKNGVYRITDTWIIGARFAPEENCFAGIRYDTSQPKSSLTQYLASRYCNAVSIQGTGNGTAIYLDFVTDTLRAGILYSVQGDTRFSKSIDQNFATLSNFGIYAKGYFNKATRTPILTSYSGGFNNNTNNQLGLLMLYDVYIKVENLTFYGLKEGLVQNNSYFAQLNNLYFKFCDRGWFSYQSHACSINNMQAGFCNKAYEVRSSELCVNNIGTSFCPVSLHVGAGSNLFNVAYFESNNAGESQIIIGDNPGDKYYTPGYSYLVDGTIMNAVTVVANKTNSTPGMGLIMKESARRLYLNGGSIQSCTKQYTNTNNKVYSQGVLGMTNSINSIVIN